LQGDFGVYVKKTPKGVPLLKKSYSKFFGVTRQQKKGGGWKLKERAYSLQDI